MLIASLLAHLGCTHYFLHTTLSLLQLAKRSRDETVVNAVRVSLFGDSSLLHRSPSDDADDAKEVRETTEDVIRRIDGGWTTRPRKEKGGVR